MFNGFLIACGVVDLDLNLSPPLGNGHRGSEEHIQLHSASYVQNRSSGVCDPREIDFSF